MPDIHTAVAAIHAGQPVIFPTETVYGIGADASNAAAVAQIFQLKGRPAYNPLIVHCANQQAAQELAQFNDTALRLADAFWPGALTMVLPRQPHARLADAVTAGLATVAVRVPSHPVAQALLAACNVPLAAPSANVSGRISPTEPQHVQALSQRASPALVVLKGGAAVWGLESTIVQPHEQYFSLLRPGCITPAMLEVATGLPCRYLENHKNTPIIAPGQLTSHYAPRLPVILQAEDAPPCSAGLTFGDVAFSKAKTVLNLSPKGDLKEAAHNLFAYLHQLDDPARYKAIYIAPIPAHGIGLAINDRLQRAAA